MSKRKPVKNNVTERDDDRFPNNQRDLFTPVELSQIKFKFLKIENSHRCRLEIEKLHRSFVGHFRAKAY